MSRAQHLDLQDDGNGKGSATSFLRGTAVGILTTTGRKSGEPRDSPLLFLRRASAWSWWPRRAAAPTNPMWYLNLKANPEVTFQIKNEVLDADRPRRHRCRARRVLAQARRDVPRLRELPACTDRKIPIVICDPD